MTGTEIIIVGGVAVVAAFLTDELLPEPEPQADSPAGRVPAGGSTLGDIVDKATTGTPVASKPKVIVGRAQSSGVSYDQEVTQSAISTPGNSWWNPTSFNGDWNNGGDVTFQAKADLATGYCEQAFNKLDELGRIEAAKKLNEYLDLSPPLNGSESFHEVVDRCAAGATTKLAKQATGALVGGTLGTVLGGIVGAYLGAKLDDFIDDSWDDCSSWFSNRYGDLKDAANWVGDKVSGAYDATLGAIF